MNNILPIWKTHASVGRSLITYEDETEILENSPVSIIAIAKKYNLDKLIVVEDSFLSFPSLYKSCAKHNIQLIFGLNFLLCNDVKDKSETSLYSNSKVSVLMKNSEGYRDLIRLNNVINAQAENFYYEPRGDWSILNDNFTNNLQLMIPSYNNFLEKNLIYNGIVIPSFGKTKPIMTYSNQEIPYDQVLIPAIQNYAKNNNYECLECHNIYYHTKADYKAYNVFRCIDNRTKFAKPNINYMSSDGFSFEGYLNKIGKTV